ncbi:hypothetical protein [Rathayibacter rathayi]|uniref:DUF4129 domain-containing protein n=1 Tax=Rathayibacter rathayi TaxID=33887 RepID=A0ABD6WAN2_RATRA|nr:hypothetical protein [Rathayibacter rathayi]PPF15331.1 hypothetical protein C5C04_03630 [Rathayibacter rathayi]PPF80228.1 hypothetical protein C5C14_06895 [Rathayibacter rathayi]PPG46353.1 hypothetical protein C5C20_02545 [Rathayibacter rathayi]PPG70844.1 hypothetical protein C5C02_03610 [Rathayibacter rathayi]PPG77912.1 hypothetical protein C5C23_04400 [Rathayibacter rathayi]
MQWWNEFLSWIRTSDGYQAVFTAAVVLLAVVIGAVVIGSVFRASIARLIRQQDHERKNAIIATLVDAAVDASAWNILSSPERVLSDRASAQAETHLRLLPVKGSGVAANWVAHELAELKHTSSTGGYQTQASVNEFRDRLVLWRDKPGRARKAFLADLERWRFSETGREGSAESALADLTEQMGNTGRSAPEGTTPPVAQPAPATPVVVGAAIASGATAGTAGAATPSIVLPPSDTDASQDETRRLLADVDRLEVPSRERPVEELPPIETQRATSGGDFEPHASAPAAVGDDGQALHSDGAEADAPADPASQDDAVVRADEARFQRSAAEDDRRDDHSAL